MSSTRTDYRTATLRPAVSFAFFVLVFLVGEVAICPTAVATKAKPCTLEWLPDELQVRLRTDYASWKIQDFLSLSPKAKARWHSERPQPGQVEPDCPGVAVGELKTSQLSYAILLVPREKPDAAYRLVIFTLSGSTTSGSLETADQWDNGGAANYYIRRVRIAKVFSREWVSKLMVAAKDGVMSVEAAENEYGVDVYFWANGQYRYEPIDH
jgi:hypothetical protein